MRVGYVSSGVPCQQYELLLYIPRGKPDSPLEKETHIPNPGLSSAQRILVNHRMFILQVTFTVWFFQMLCSNIPFNEDGKTQLFTINPIFFLKSLAMGLYQWKWLTIPSQVYSKRVFIALCLPVPYAFGDLHNSDSTY